MIIKNRSSHTHTYPHPFIPLSDKWDPLAQSPFHSRGKLQDSEQQPWSFLSNSSFPSFFSFLPPSFNIWKKEAMMRFVCHGKHTGVSWRSLHVFPLTCDHPQSSHTLLLDFVPVSLSSWNIFLQPLSFWLNPTSRFCLSNWQVGAPGWGRHSRVGCLCPLEIVLS